MRGINNPGNYCYLIATLQFLLQSRDFIHYLNKNENLKAVEKIFRIFAKTHDEDNTSPNSKLHNIILLLQKQNTDFFNGEQKDASECLMIFFSNFIDNKKDIVTQQVFNRTCQECNLSKIKYELMFPIQVSKVDNGFPILCPNQYSKQIQTLEMLCETCKKNQMFNEKTGYVVCNGGKNIIMTIKRFGDMGKDNSPIENLIFDQHWILKSIICHRGNFHSGHYYCIVYKNNQWIMLNDSSVSPITNENALHEISNFGYVLLYRHKR